MKKDWMIKESELDDDQMKVLMATLDKSCVTMGCAGSGKSILALIKAQRVQKERGDDYEIIVFTKALCGYMNSGREELGLHNPFYYHYEWKKRRHCPQADYVIVDEIQDFSEDEIKEFIAATRKYFFFFGDTAQSVYSGLKTTMPVEEIPDLFERREKPKSFELYRNYRLPIPVARFVQYIGWDLPPFIESTYKSKEKEKPYILQYGDIKDQVKSICDIIRNKDMTDVAILAPTNDMVGLIAGLLDQYGINYELKNGQQYTLNFSTTNIKLMTYHSAKGLQFENVFLPMIGHFCEMEDKLTEAEHQHVVIENKFMDNYDYSDAEKGYIAKRKVLYVAMTRTYKNLYVMYTGKLPSLLAKIPNELYRKSETEKIGII